MWRLISLLLSCLVCVASAEYDVGIPLNGTLDLTNAVVLVADTTNDLGAVNLQTANSLLVTDEGGAAFGTSSDATYGGAVGNGAVATYGGAMGRDATTDIGGAIGRNAEAGGGGAVGYGSVTDLGGAIGASAESDDGGAIGQNAVTVNGGAIGYNASASYGGAVGNLATTTFGGAIGSGAESTIGGAIGQNAEATSGFSGGYAAKSVNNSAQLAYGSNTNTYSLQFYNKTIMLNADQTQNALVLYDETGTAWEIYISTNGVISTAISTQL